MAKSVLCCWPSRWRRGSSSWWSASGSAGAGLRPHFRKGSTERRGYGSRPSIWVLGLGGLGLASQVAEQGAELFRNLRAKHSAHDRSEWATDLDRLADLGFRARRFDPAVESKFRARHDACLELEAFARLDVDELHLVMLPGFRVHDAGRARDESAVPVHRRYVGVPFTPRRHVRPEPPGLVRRSGGFNGGAVLASHRFVRQQMSWSGVHVALRRSGAS